MYEISFMKQAEDFLKRLDKQNQERISKKIDELKQNPKLGDPLLGRLSGLWKLRIGDYRAIYKIIKEKVLIVILKLGHRKNVYDI